MKSAVIVFVIVFAALCFGPIVVLYLVNDQGSTMAESATIGSRYGAALRQSGLWLAILAVSLAAAFVTWRRSRR